MPNRSRTRISAAGFLLAGLLLSCPSQAVVYCASNETELRAAFAAIASTSSTASNEIRLTRRVFFNGAQLFGGQLAGVSGDFRLSGGWSGAGSSACDVQTQDARLTVLDAQQASAVLAIQRSGAPGGTTPLMAVSNLTLRNGRADSAPVGLYVYNSFGSIEVDDVIVHGHRATASQYLGGVAITLDSSSRDIRLRNALVYDSEGVFIAGGPPLANVLFTSLSLNPDRNWYSTNNTILAGPNSSAPALRMQSDGNFWVVNTIARGVVEYAGSITGSGSSTAPKLRQLFNNFAAMPSTQQTVVMANTQNTLVDPQLDPVSREPLPDSPMVDAGLGAPPGGSSAGDTYGRPRSFGAVIDIGSLESQVLPTRVFSNGFE